MLQHPYVFDIQVVYDWFHTCLWVLCLRVTIYVLSCSVFFVYVCVCMCVYFTGECVCGRMCSFVQFCINLMWLVAMQASNM